MKLTYLDKYHFFNETIMPDSPVVVKAGVLGIGDLVAFLNLYPEASILALEADPAAVKAQAKQAKQHTIHLENLALVGKRRREVTLYRYTNAVSNSIYPRHKKEPHLKLQGKKPEVRVQGVSLSGVMKEFSIKKIDLLILNCEGAEQEVLEDIIRVKATRDKISQICVSFHTGKIYPVEIRESVLRRLEKTHHVIPGETAVPGGIPDHLLIRKV